MNKLVTAIPYSNLVLTGIILGVGLYVGVRVARLLVRKSIFSDDMLLKQDERIEIVVH